ncbi:hypothetical protein SLEP1_g36083 [Rubroshorea leprosula]|uniref:Protein kinase domain-containing protein n=1 Tax=Rubroshorea leprosula TaxID=152421 RepID=A0AAV5KQQ5_9ROSI|nr:hypothetical protein SLEP1_g36083 [Rubroshorea leprosula]
MMIITRTSVFAVLQLLMIESAVGQALVKPGWKEHCGNVSIPYPFGIRADRYMHKESEVSCSDTSNPPTNLLTSIETEVLYFSLDHSIVNVKIPIISQQCSVSLNFLDISGSPLMSYRRRMLLLPEGYVPAVPLECKKTLSAPLDKVKPFISASIPEYLVGISLVLGVVCLPIVKKSKILHKEKVKEFINEVVILTQINHRDIVKLLDCCLETELPVLVYEFISNGTLFQYIHDYNEDFPLTWERRLTIAAEVADALSYLHSAASISNYYRDVKSSNILPDEKYRAIVSNFGTSRSIAIDQTHLTTNVKGAFSLSGKKRPKMIEVVAEIEQIHLSQNISNGQQNHEAARYVKTEVTNLWDGASTSTGSGLDS